MHTISIIQKNGTFQSEMFISLKLDLNGARYYSKSISKKLSNDTSVHTLYKAFETAGLPGEHVAPVFG